MGTIEQTGHNKVHGCWSGTEPQVLGELANVIVRHSQLSLKDCGDQEFPWKKANVTVIFRKARKDLGKYRLVSLTCEGDGANPPGNHFPTSQGQRGHWKQSARFYEREIMPDLILLQKDGWINEKS